MTAIKINNKFLAPIITLCVTLKTSITVTTVLALRWLLIADNWHCIIDYLLGQELKIVWLLQRNLLAFVESGLTAVIVLSATVHFRWFPSCHRLLGYFYDLDDLIGIHSFLWHWSGLDGSITLIAFFGIVLVCMSWFLSLLPVSLK